MLPEKQKVPAATCKLRGLSLVWSAAELRAFLEAPEKKRAAIATAPRSPKS